MCVLFYLPQAVALHESPPRPLELARERVVRGTRGCVGESVFDEVEIPPDIYISVRGDCGLDSTQLFGSGGLAARLEVKVDDCE